MKLPVLIDYTKFAGISPSDLAFKEDGIRLNGMVVPCWQFVCTVITR